MSIVRKAVITAAGRGTRQYPATSVVQKEMLPLVDRDGLTKPVIQIIAEEAFEAGIEEICIVVSPGDEAQFRQHFRAITEDVLPAFAGKEWALRESDKLARMEQALTFVVSPCWEGYGHAVYQSRDFAGDEPFLSLLGDDIYMNHDGPRCAEATYRDLLRDQSRLDFRGEIDGFRPIAPVRDDARASAGAGGATDAIAAIEEKPSADYARKHLVTPGLAPGFFLCHFGMHVFSPAIFDCLEYLIRNEIRNRGEIQLTAAQQLLRGQTPHYYCCELNGERYDTGVPFGLMEAQLALALSGRYRQEIVESVARLLAQQLRSISGSPLG